MNYTEEVRAGKTLIAIIIREPVEVDGVSFFTGELNPFQVGIQHREGGTTLDPHIHKIDSPLTIKEVQELLHVIYGKIKVNLFDKRGGFIKSKILLAGDSILLCAGGHGVKFLLKSKVLIIKQGPFEGTRHDKIYLR